MDRDASYCSCSSCHRPAEFWYYSNSQRLQMTIIFGRCPFHNRRDFAGDNTDAAALFIPNNAVPISREDLIIISVMQS
jgi:hypothetical protein